MSEHFSSMQLLKSEQLWKLSMSILLFQLMSEHFSSMQLLKSEQLWKLSMSMLLFRWMSEHYSSMQLQKTEQFWKLSISINCAVVEIVFVDAAAPDGVWSFFFDAEKLRVI